MPRGVRTLLSPYNALHLPNAGSKYQTPASLKIDLHYAHLEIYERWNWARFIQLAKFLNITPFELGSIACITHDQVESFSRTNRLRIGQASNRSAALVLTLLESHCCKAYTTDVIENPFPDLNVAAPCTR